MLDFLCGRNSWDLDEYYSLFSFCNDVKDDEGYEISLKFKRNTFFILCTSFVLPFSIFRWIFFSSYIWWPTSNVFIAKECNFSYASLKNTRQPNKKCYFIIWKTYILSAFIRMQSICFFQTYFFLSSWISLQNTQFQILILISVSEYQKDFQLEEKKTSIKQFE